MGWNMKHPNDIPKSLWWGLVHWEAIFDDYLLNTFVELFPPIVFLFWGTTQVVLHLVCPLFHFSALSLLVLCDSVIPVIKSQWWLPLCSLVLLSQLSSTTIFQILLRWFPPFFLFLYLVCLLVFTEESDLSLWDLLDLSDLLIAAWVLLVKGRVLTISNFSSNTHEFSSAICIVKQAIFAIPLAMGIISGSPGSAGCAEIPTMVSVLISMAILLLHVICIDSGTRLVKFVLLQ